MVVNADVIWALLSRDQASLPSLSRERSSLTSPAADQARLTSPSGDQAHLRFLGQAGFLISTANCTVVIDPYLSDSVSRDAPEFARKSAPPIRPDELRADVFIITHDHGDHLDRDTLEGYRHKQDTVFVGPRLVCSRLREMGFPAQNIVRVDSGEQEVVCGGVRLSGIYAAPTSADVPDTCGYLIEFDNGRSIYHCSDTALSDVLLEGSPRAEVLLVCINGKWRNLDVHGAVKLAQAVRPRYAVPCHYDVMALNAENPHTFEFFMRQAEPDIEVRILDYDTLLVW